MTDLSTSFTIFTASAKIWLFLYGILLLTGDMIFTCICIPTTVLMISLIYCALLYGRVAPPDPELLKEVFGEDANILVEKYRRNQMADLSFVPTTSRLALANMTPVSSSKIGSATNPHHQTKEAEQPYTMWTIAHRGAGLDAPENSLSAFRLCKTRGCLAIEFDVTLTKDGVAVVFHDDKLDRIANIDRDIRDMTFEEVIAVDISVNHPLGKKYAGERIPTFDETITTCLELDLRFFIDLKDPEPKMVQVVLDAYQKYGEPMYKRAVVSSFYPTLIYQIRKRDPKIIGCMAWRPSYYQYADWNGDLQNLKSRYTIFYANWWAILTDMALKWALPNVLWWFLGLSALLINKDGVTKEEATKWMKRGLRIFAWTVNSPVEKLHFTYNFQMGCLTDTLDGGDLKVVGSSPPNISASKRRAASAEPSSSSRSSSGINSGPKVHPGVNGVVASSNPSEDDLGSSS